MKTRILFLTLLTSISILLIANSFAFADSITGCIRNGTGAIYNVQIGGPPLPCSILDEQISWNSEGPPGADGADGADGAEGPQGSAGEDGQDGADASPQFILRDDNGDEVGPVITVNVGAPSYIPAVLPLFEERSVLTSLDVQKADASTVTVGVPAIRSGFQFQGRLVFEGTGCAGTPRFRTDIHNLDFFPAYALSAVVGTPGQPDVRKLYVQANEAEEPTMLTYQSILVGDFCISPINISGLSVSMELINVPLNVTHPGPFTLEKSTGAAGTGINLVQLEDSNVGTCEAPFFPDAGDPSTWGWCPTGLNKFFFFIADPVITNGSVAYAHVENNLGGFSFCHVEFIDPVLHGFKLVCEGIIDDGLKLNYAIINP